MRERVKREEMMVNPLPKDRIYIYNAADATPRIKEALFVGRSILGGVNTSRFGRFGPRRPLLVLRRQRSRRLQ
jgi:hypothetical protein